MVNKRVIQNFTVSDLGWVGLAEPIRFRLNEFDVGKNAPRRVRKLWLQQFSNGNYVSSISLAVEELPAFLEAINSLEVPAPQDPPPDLQLRLNGDLNGY